MYTREHIQTEKKIQSELAVCKLSALVKSPHLTITRKLETENLFALQGNTEPLDTVTLIVT